jgi:hypothetical protein
VNELKTEFEPLPEVPDVVPPEDAVPPAPTVIV